MATVRWRSSALAAPGLRGHTSCPLHLAQDDIHGASTMPAAMPSHPMLLKACYADASLRAAGVSFESGSPAVTDTDRLHCLLYVRAMRLLASC